MTPEEQRLKKNQESLASYNWYKAHHVCVRCRNASATDGLVTYLPSMPGSDECKQPFSVCRINTRTESRTVGEEKSSQSGMASRWALYPLRQEARGQAAFNLRTLQEKG